MDYYEPEDFIRVYDNCVSREFCKGVIDYFEWCSSNNKTWQRIESRPLFKKDESTTLNPQNYWDIDFSNQHLSGYLNEFNISFWDNCYSDYRKEFDTLNSFERHTIFTYKVQKTTPSGGYHVWHCEGGIMEHSRRILAYALFLNDVVEGGETEFLYQRKRIPAREGSLVIFPAAFTHTHRGNPPLRGTKYIMTGWIEFN